VETNLCVVLLKINGGVLQYAVSTHVLSLSNAVVTDGEWHRVEVKWTSDSLTIDIDYGMAQASLVYAIIILKRMCVCVSVSVCVCVYVCVLH